ncbi:MAG: hypothetical protein GT601_03230 [Acidaminobacter sp.]|uniref:S-layer homology domain-containing protein n=1 Tax=Acidaminobacter sp. TaxID=1872102 RepID=UPI0013827819|nr:S-layer homology domain-containing protein [Acidaminobacter sp.]MZQ96668.1 hypothetical protein [Acidaminobacter sp.]
MKRVLSLVLALVLVLGMIPMGFAADQTAGEILKGMNLLAGDENGNLNEDQNLNRAEMMVIMARMMGKFEEAKSFALPSTFTDLAGFSWAVPYIAYAEMNEWTAGVGAGMFNPAGAVTAQEVAVFMLKALGYEADVDFTWANAVEVATAKGLMAGVSTPATSSILRGDLFKVMYTTLNTNVKGEAVALGVKLGYMQPAVLAVSSVKALNANEIEIVFTKAVNEGSAEDEENYELKVGSVELDSIDFEAERDKTNVVILTLEDAAQAITSINVTVSEDLLDADMNELGADYKTVFIFYDDAAPEVVSAEVDSNILTVTFNEYVGAIGLVKVDGVAMTDGDEYDLTEPVKELEIDIQDLDLEDGKYTATFANVEDLQDDANVAGFIATSFIISDTDAAPVVVGVEQTSDYEFEIEFTKNLKYAPTVTAKNGGIDIVTDVVMDEADVWVVSVDPTLADDMYDDGDDVFNLAVTVTSYQAAVNDMYGSKYTTTLKMSLDTTSPALLAGQSKVVDDQYFELRFDEIIVLADDYATTDVLVVDEDGVKLAVAGLMIVEDTDEDETILSVDMGIDGIGSGTFTLTVAKGTVEDESGNGNKAFTTTVKKSASSDDIMVVDVYGSDNTIYVEFSDEMGSSALVAANYKLDGASLPAGTALYFESADKDVVMIELPDGAIKDSDPVVLAISNKVLGSDGEEIDSDDLYQIVYGLADNVKPVLKAAEKSDSSTITLTFSEDLGTFALTDFEVTINGVVVDLDSFMMIDEDEYEIYTLNDYNTNQTVVVEVVDSEGTADVAGNAITEDTKVTATK